MILVDQLFPTFTLTLSMLMYLVFMERDKSNIFTSCRALSGKRYCGTFFNWDWISSWVQLFIMSQTCQILRVFFKESLQLFRIDQLIFNSLTLASLTAVWVTALNASSAR